MDIWGSKLRLDCHSFSYGSNQLLCFSRGSRTAVVAAVVVCMPLIMHASSSVLSLKHRECWLLVLARFTPCSQIALLFCFVLILLHIFFFLFLVCSGQGNAGNSLPYEWFICSDLILIIFGLFFLVLFKLSIYIWPGVIFLVFQLLSLISSFSFCFVDFHLVNSGGALSFCCFAGHYFLVLAFLFVGCLIYLLLKFLLRVVTLCLCSAQSVFFLLYLFSHLIYLLPI